MKLLNWLSAHPVLSLVFSIVGTSAVWCLILPWVALAPPDKWDLALVLMLLVVGAWMVVITRMKL